MTQQQGDIRCHFDVLGVPRDADAAAIKRAHRKLALRWHPDKNGGCREAEREFKLVQEAYECLSDPVERKWYEEHRESVLRGGRGYDDGCEGGGGADVSFLFDVIPFQYAGCYDGYGDEAGDFYAVYSDVFRRIMEGEKAGYVSEGNIDEAEMPNARLLDVAFGSSRSDWSDVTAFYGAWESFNSCLSFAWADVYDPRDAPNRRVRRAVDDENRRARRAARRERQEDVLALVRFVKRRDPRVRAAKARTEREREERAREAKREVERKREEAARAREAWREEAAKAMAEAEERDMEAGRVRLADLDDDDDFYGSKKKGKKKKKKKGKKAKKNRGEADQVDGSQAAEEGESEEAEVSAGAVEPADAEETETASNPNVDADAEVTETASNPNVDAEENQVDDEEIGEEEPPLQGAGDAAEEAICDDYGSESEEEEEEPDVWRCECCRKDFKSEGQMQNHLKSKKHKEARKKYEKRMQKEAKERAVMEEMLDEMAI